MKRSACLALLGILVLVGGLFLPSYARAEGDYSFTYTPAPDGNGIFNLSTVEHPKITIQPTYFGSDYYPKYWLSIHNLDGDFDKTAWDRPVHEGSGFDFNPAYTWDLCKGNGDHTSGEVSIELEGETSSGGRVPLYSDNVFIVNYQGQCRASAGEQVPSSDAMKLSVQSSSATEVVFVMTDSRLQPFYPRAGGSYKFLLYLRPEVGEDVLKKEFSVNGSSLQATWDSSGSETGTFTFFAEFVNSSTGTHQKGPALTVQKGSDGVTSSTSGGVPGPSSGSSSGGQTSDLVPISFDVPDFSRLKDVPRTLIFNAAYQVVIEYLLIVFSAFALIAFLYSGIMYGVSYGDPTKAERAKKNFLWSVYGVLVLLLGVTMLVLISRMIKTLGI